MDREFPDSPVVRIGHFHSCGQGSIPSQGTKIPQAKKKVNGWKKIYHTNTNQKNAGIAN